MKEKERETLKAVQTINSVLNNKDFKLQIAFKTFKTSAIFPNKDKIPPSLSSNVVYEFKCRQCSNCYVGETRRHLSTRMAEHLRGKPTPTEITLHPHEASTENFKVIFKTFHTRIAETLCMTSCPPYQRKLIIDPAACFQGRGGAKK